MAALSLYTGLGLIIIISLTSSVDIDFYTGTIHLPTALTRGCMTTISDGTIYNFGGIYTDDDSLSYSDTILTYNPSTSTTFEELDNITTPNTLYCLQNTVYSTTTGLIYILGSNSRSNAKNYVFDPSISQFVDTSSLSLTSDDYFHSSCVAIVESGDFNVIYIYGGVNEEYEKQSTLKIYDLDTNSFKDDISDGPLAGSSSACIAVDQYFFVFGGQMVENNASTDYSDILRYEL